MSARGVDLAWPARFLHLAAVVQTLDSAINRIKSIQWIAQLVSLILIRWIVIYPVDSAIQRLNNRGLLNYFL